MRDTLGLGFKLLLITAIAGLLLGFTNEITKAPIEEQGMLAAVEARQSVLPDAEVFVPITDNAGDYDESIPNDAIELVKSYSFSSLPQGDAALDNAYVGISNSTIVGFVAQITVKGYGGEIEVVVGIDTDGTICGVNVGGNNFSETAGLGAKAKSPDFTDQFTGIVLDAVDKRMIELGKAGQGKDVDAITAATITSKAVVGGVNTSAEYLLSLIEIVGGGNI